ncbi:MAG: HAMP domain-containing sensor histidine kinase [Lachnospiraceae bacterium]|nr:HAMP domain-containing sensor histidine kinase [Lachnospiraceae bacterium]
MIIFLVIILLLIGYEFVQKRKYNRFYNCVNSMLDDIIYGREIQEPNLTEKAESVIANKIFRISDKLNFEIGQAVTEREKIKMLISDMSHQLKTPLANVMMYGDILKNMELDKERRVLFQTKLCNQTEKIAWIMNSLFKMTRLEEGVLEFEVSECDIQDTIQRAVNDVREKARAKNIKIQINNLEEKMAFHNEKWTAEVLQNLLENAIKYSAKDDTIQIFIEQQATYTQINVSDNGLGISKQDQINIFKRFYRSKDVEKYEGSGIGLYLSRLILEKERGYITVESTKGVGSCFSVFLLNCKE